MKTSRVAAFVASSSMVITLAFAALQSASAYGNASDGAGSSGGSFMTNNPAGSAMGDERLGYLQSSEGACSRKSTQPNMPEYTGSDVRDSQGTAVPGEIDGSKLKCAMYSLMPPIPASFLKFQVPAKEQEDEIKNAWIPTTGAQLTDSANQAQLAVAGNVLLSKLTDPQRIVPAAQAAGQAQALGAGNAAGEVARDQSASAIDFCSKYLTNFTVDPGNKWNQIRNNIFVPMAILLLLPGAVLAQVRAIAAAGSPVLGEVNPFEGILRSLVAIFLIPGTYLVINYGIDLSNSITYTINAEYTRLFGSNMYRDAICAEIRATPIRHPAENRNALDQKTAQMGPLLGGSTPFAQFEGKLMENSIEDPCAGIKQAPQDRADEAISSASVATRMMMNGSNASLSSAWNILCAFQMAYLYYLWCVGPIMAALWVWPIKQLRQALPSWIEGVITLCFWSLFWNTVILLMACFKGVDETGTLIMTALNFLATASVKYAFDFAGLVKAAGQEAAGMAAGAAQHAAQGSSGGGHGSRGGSAHGGGHQVRHGAAGARTAAAAHAFGGGGSRVAGAEPAGGHGTHVAGNETGSGTGGAENGGPIRLAMDGPIPPGFLANHFGHGNLGSTRASAKDDTPLVPLPPSAAKAAGPGAVEGAKGSVPHSDLPLKTPSGSEVGASQFAAAAQAGDALRNLHFTDAQLQAIGSHFPGGVQGFEHALASGQMSGMMAAEYAAAAATAGGAVNGGDEFNSLFMDGTMLSQGFDISNMSIGGDNLSIGGDSLNFGGSNLSFGGDNVSFGGDNVNFGGDNVALNSAIAAGDAAALANFTQAQEQAQLQAMEARQQAHEDHRKEHLLEALQAAAAANSPNGLPLFAQAGIPGNVCGMPQVASDWSSPPPLTTDSINALQAQAALNQSETAYLSSLASDGQYFVDNNMTIAADDISNLTSNLSIDGDDISSALSTANNFVDNSNTFVDPNQFSKLADSYAPVSLSDDPSLIPPTANFVSNDASVRNADTALLGSIVPVDSSLIPPVSMLPDGNMMVAPSEWARHAAAEKAVMDGYANQPYQVVDTSNMQVPPSMLNSAEANFYNQSGSFTADTTQVTADTINTSGPSIFGTDNVSSPYAPTVDPSLLRQTQEQFCREAAPPVAQPEVAAPGSYSNGSTSYDTTNSYGGGNVSYESAPPAAPMNTGAPVDFGNNAAAASTQIDDGYYPSYLLPTNCVQAAPSEGQSNHQPTSNDAACVPQNVPQNISWSRDEAAYTQNYDNSSAYNSHQTATSRDEACYVQNNDNSSAYNAHQAATSRDEACYVQNYDNSSAAYSSQNSTSSQDNNSWVQNVDNSTEYSRDAAAAAASSCGPALFGREPREQSAPTYSESIVPPTAREFQGQQQQQSTYVDNSQWLERPAAPALSGGNAQAAPVPAACSQDGDSSVMHSWFFEAPNRSAAEVETQQAECTAQDPEGMPNPAHVSPITSGEAPVSYQQESDVAIGKGRQPFDPILAVRVNRLTSALGRAASTGNNLPAAQPTTPKFVPTHVPQNYHNAPTGNEPPPAMRGGLEHNMGPMQAGIRLKKKHEDEEAMLKQQLEQMTGAPLDL